jgi:hypothetical protein
LLRTLKRDEATTILRDFLSEYASSVQHVSLIAAEKFGSKEYILRIRATLNQDSCESLRMLLKLKGYVMEEKSGFILIDNKPLNQSPLLAC